ncbi:CHAT domain-containing protein [Streptomyces sp. NPDC048277]|uniref:CHAT domain-containing protein n=1 Tax=Streptomyces sp. NPDC048277 TaxID=3155027 RepID=UPI0033EB221D
MSELRERVTARLVTAQHARDPAPLRDQDAVADALALLREAAPAPADPVDLDSVAAVFWTFWFRHQGAEDPDAAQNLTLVFGTFGFLCPRLPEGAGLPEALREGFDPADPSHEARFAYLMSAAHAEVAGDGSQEERTAALEAAIAWSDTSFEYVQAEDHAGFVELAVHAHDLHLTRFQSAADPDGLAAAATYGRQVCTRFAAAEPGMFDPDGARAVVAATLRTVVDAARLLGTPRLDVVERLVAAVPDGALTPETAEGLRFLRMLDAQPVTWPGERDLVVGAAIAEAGIAEHDMGRVACAVRRLRTALAATPAGHPAHPEVTTALGRVLMAFAAEREDEAAAVEAMELLDSVGSLSDDQRAMLAAYRQLDEARRSEDPAALERVAPILGSFAERVRESAARAGGPVDIDLEIIDLAAGFEPDDASDERIARYRTTLAALPADRPNRHAYVAVLAALTGLRAEALRDTAPDRAGLLSAESGELTEEAVAAAPAGFLAADLLRRGLFEAALPLAVMSATTGDVPDGELRATVERLTRMGDVRLDGAGSLDADIEIVRELLAGTGEDDQIRPYLSAVLGTALSARSAGRADPAALAEIVELLRYARSNAPDMPGEFDRILADALTTLSIGRFDAEGAREAAALLASAQGAPGIPAVEGAPRPGDPVLSETDKTVLAGRTELHNALQNYLFGHEPAQLERARRVARRMRDVTRAAAPAGDERPWYDLMGDAYVDLVETIGPGGGPRQDLDDAVVDQCRATFARCAPGHPMRPMIAMTLVRALAQRAILLRATEPERAQSLLAEAEELSRDLTVEMPEGSPVDVGATMRTFLDLLGRGRLPEVTTETGAARPADPEDLLAADPADFLSAVLAPIQERLSGVADPDAWRGAGIPVWMRAHGEIGAAAGALGRRPPRVDLALSHLEAGVEAMAGVTDRGSDQASAEHGLSTFEGDIRSITELLLANLVGQSIVDRLPAHVKALEESVRAVRAGQTPHLPASLRRTAEGPDVDRAAELLERGRGLLLARRIEARADIGDLRAQHPELADEFERLTEQLDAPTEAPPGAAAAGDAEWARLTGLRASRELDDVVGRIRTRPGFEGFLRPLTAEESRALAADGPVVVLNHGRRLCHALVVTDGSITALHLDVEADEVTDTARKLRDAVDAINARGMSRPSPLQLVAAGRTVRETLAWTWHKIVRPVLELAGSADPVPPHDGWPRIWWVPTGPFSALPLHAAQCTAPDCELGNCGAALDAVVSSYVPGLQTLAYARARARRRGTADHGSALLVAAPEDDLPGVAAAAAHAAELLGANEPLIGPAATREAVLAALHDASWAHFGCHAATDPSEPSGALLHLPSGEPVSVLEICRARPRAAQLAFLAACGTARTAERLTDEAIHITSSFLLAGFPTAVGTLWTIDSTHAEHMTREFYRRTTATDAPGAAHALHDTVRQLRRRIPDRPHIWAAYVHAGT